MFQVAIVGRPNVGKSTLFNRFCGRRKAIVGNEPGITRDRIYGTARLKNKVIGILDTGGMIPQERDAIPVKVFEQVEKAIAESNLILFMVDGRAGITSLDEQLLPMLRRTGRPIWTIVNKIDTPALESHAGIFYSLGTQEVFAISAEHGRGTKALMDAIASRVGEHSIEAEDNASEIIAVAVVGRPNVGKSSLVNRLVGFDRAIVTEIPGTTRDAVDTLLVRGGDRYRIIDTAGIRRKGKTRERTDKISVVMARKNLEQADVALLLIDAEEGITGQDASIGGYAVKSGCSVIIVLNKWDKVSKDQYTIETYTEAVRRRMKYLGYAPILTVSALTGQRVSKLFEMIRKAYEARHIRIPTGALNNIFVPDLSQKFAAHHSQQKLQIRYVTQVGSNPPTFAVFTSTAEPLHFSTERFLVNQLRQHFGFYAAPILIRQKQKQSRRRHPETIKGKD